MSEAAQPVEIVGDIRTLPNYAMGPPSLLWWGTLGFMMVEGAAFALACGAYLYILGQGSHWPPVGDRPPSLLVGTVFTLVLLASLVPNFWLEGMTKAQKEVATRWGALLMTVIGAVLLVIRAVELTQLNVRWDHDAYGSLIWLLIVLHTTHVITDLGDTAVLTLWLFTHEPDGRQYSDVKDNASYWTFVVASWLPLYALIYWGPRWL